MYYNYTNTEKTILTS